MKLSSVTAPATWWSLENKESFLIYPSPFTLCPLTYQDWQISLLNIPRVIRLSASSLSPPLPRPLSPLATESPVAILYIVDRELFLEGKPGCITNPSLQSFNNFHYFYSQNTYKEVSFYLPSLMSQPAWPYFSVWMFQVISYHQTTAYTVPLPWVPRNYCFLCKAWLRVRFGLEAFLRHLIRTPTGNCYLSVSPISLSIN